MKPKKISILLTLLIALMATQLVLAQDSIPPGFSRMPEWRVGIEATPSWVIPTGSFLKGDNPEGKNIRSGLSGAVRAGFSFNPNTREGVLYPGLYQGVGAVAYTHRTLPTD
ncbi:MAG: hypothetical protein K2H72_09285 [Muribaculaceae bacterium]|nr:hypothetical protein [Muribaculaceae bacterium]